MTLKLVQDNSSKGILKVSNFASEIAFMMLDDFTQHIQKSLLKNSQEVGWMFWINFSI